MARRTPAAPLRVCTLLRRSNFERSTSELGHSGWFGDVGGMSAYPPIATVCCATASDVVGRNRRKYVVAKMTLGCGDCCSRPPLAPGGPASKKLGRGCALMRVSAEKQRLLFGQIAEKVPPPGTRRNSDYQQLS